MTRAPEVVGARLLTTAALARGVVALVGTGDGGALVTGVIGALVIGGAELTRTAVIGRGRPVLSPRADRVDRRLRAVAVVLVGRLEVAAAVLTLGWVVSAVPIGTEVGRWLQPVAVLAALVVALVWLHRAAPRPPRRWSPSELSVVDSP